MTDALKEAIEVLRNLPEDRQASVARVILDFALDEADTTVD